MPTSPSSSSRPAALDGIVGVPATPFTADNRVDVASLRRYAQHYAARGALGFLAPAVAGEVEMLTEAERELVVSTLLDATDGRVPIIGGATASDQRGRVAATRRLIELGCAGVLAYIRYEDEASYSDAVHELGALQPGFLMIQDLDGGPGGPLPVPLIARLHREVPCFTWIKIETADRCRKISAVRAATGPSLRIGTAGPDLIELLDRGVDAYLSTYSLSTYAEIWRLHRAGQRAEAIAAYRRLLPLLAFMATHQRIQWRFTKAILQAEGLFAETRVRVGAPLLDSVEERLFAELCVHARELAQSASP